MNKEESGFFELSIGVLRDPLSTFKRINEGDITKGFLLIVVLVVLTAISTLFYMNKIPLEILVPQIVQDGTDSSIITESIVTISIILRVIGTMLSYIFPVLVIHGIAKITRSNGVLKKAFAINGFASLPLLVQQMFKVFDSFFSSPESLITFQLAKMEITGRFMKTVARMNFFTVFGIATWIIIGFGVSVNYGMTRRRSLIIALVPYLLLFAFNFYLIG